MKEGRDREKKDELCLVASHSNGANMAAWQSGGPVQ